MIPATRVFSQGLRMDWAYSRRLGVKLVDVFFGVGQKIDEVDFVGPGAANLLEGELGPVAIDFDAGLHFHEVIAVDVPGDDVEEIPHAGFDGAAAVAELEA